MANLRPHTDQRAVWQRLVSPSFEVDDEGIEVDRKFTVRSDLNEQFTRRIPQLPVRVGRSRCSERILIGGQAEPVSVGPTRTPHVLYVC